jgi:hypothetical protein
LEFVFTGGKTNGCEKAESLGVAMGTATTVALDVFGALAKRMPRPAKAAAIISANNPLSLILIPRNDH